MKKIIFATATAALLFFLPQFSIAQQSVSEPSVQVFPFTDTLANTFFGYVLDSASSVHQEHYRYDKLRHLYFWLRPEVGGVYIELYDYDASGERIGRPRHVFLGRDKTLGWFTYSKANEADLHAFLVEAVRRFNSQ